MTWRCSTCRRVNLGRNMACLGCGDPKDASERYEMPTDTARAPSVTDPALLREAKGGSNWRCRYCGSDQRRTDGACVQCGGTPHEGRRRSFVMGVVSELPRHERVAAIIGLVGLVMVVATFVAWVARTRTYDATVSAVHWEQRIVVERYQVWPREGWRRDVGVDAFDVEHLGQRIHHYEQVLDGYDVESYTVSVACGHDCSPVPETCSESCSSNDNGFATCRTTCSGGGQSCSTRYCTEWRTRDVPRYRDEPRYAAWIRYRIWDWGHARTASASGSAVDDVHWPEGGAQGEADPNGERERETRDGDYCVQLDYDEDEQIVVDVTADAFIGFALGSVHTLALGFRSIEVDGAPVRRSVGG